ncbi:spermatogenesis associated protein 5 [Podila epicladia]|nr:spermatogenesis associated protein 5 [Podila epicladia]
MHLLAQQSPSARNVRAVRRAFLNVETMRHLRLAAGDHVLVQGNGDSTAEGDSSPGSVAIAWPSLTVSENHIQLSSVSRLNANVAVGDPVEISLIQTAIHEATQLTLTALHPIPFVSNILFTLFAKEIMAEIKFVLKDNMIEFPYNGKPQRFKVTSILLDRMEQGGSIFAIGQDTVIKILPFSPQAPPMETSTIDPTSTTKEGTSTYEQIGGLGAQIKTVREMVEIPLHNPQIFTQFGLRPPKGVLLFGPPGTGKTLIARTVAKATGAFLTVINGPEIISKFYGETEAKLRAIFEQAADNSPSIIFIDEIDALCPKRDEAASEMEKRVVATLLTLMDGVSEKKVPSMDSGATGPRVVVMGATNRPNALDEALRRPGRFDREIEIGIPDSRARGEILTALLKKIPNTLTLAEIDHLASISHGYVGADLAAVCREAGLKTINRIMGKRHPFFTQDGGDAALALQDQFRAMSVSGAKKDDQGTQKEQGPEELLISAQDMKLAMTDVKPSAMREVMIEVPKVLWSDIGGQAEIKQKLKESVEWPLQLFSKWVGESEKAVREVFRKARAASPSIVFFDEIDALTVKRGGGDDGGSSVADRVLSQLLNELDGIEPLVNVTVVAATNRPDIMDPALMRPGRIDRILYVSPPDLASRTEILRLQIETKKMACGSDVVVADLALRTEGCSGAEVVALCQEAAMKAMEESLEIECVSKRHFDQALASMTRRITPEMIQFYDQFRQKSGLKSV